MKKTVSERSTIGSQKKELGHAEERIFNAFFGDKEKRQINYSGASFDNEISNINYKNKIKNILGKVDSYKVSLKSGETWQFHIGRIDELSPLNNIKLKKTIKNETKVIHSVSFEEQQKTLSNISFWKKYLGKGDLLCFNDKKKTYTFFRMDNVISFISKNVSWRILDTGRIKGDILYQNKKRSVLTFEYRDLKKQFVIGANGSKNGLLLFKILKSNLKFCEIEFDTLIEENKFIKIPKSTFNNDLEGQIGDTFFDSNYFYICVDQNKWKRIKLEDIK